MVHGVLGEEFILMKKVPYRKNTDWSGEAQGGMLTRGTRGTGCTMEGCQREQRLGWWREETGGAAGYREDKGYRAYGGVPQRM